MRLKEFLTEQQLDQVHDLLDVAHLSLPYTYRMNKLENQDFYDLYRFGVAIAAVRGEEGDKNPINKAIHQKNTPNFRAQSSWGEHLIVSGFDPNLGKIAAKAAAKINKSGMTTVSTPGSDEMKDTDTVSPIKAFRGYE